MTTDQLQQSDPATTTHEHGWVIESAHRTSQGQVLYVRCASCHTRRVDLQDHSGQPPSAISATVPN